MTKKYFEKIAKIILEEGTLKASSLGEEDIVLGIVDSLADTFEKENPRFNKKKFYEKCGLPSFFSER